MPSIPSMKLNRFKIQTTANTPSTNPAEPSWTTESPTRIPDKAPKTYTANTAAPKCTVMRMATGASRMSSQNPIAAMLNPPRISTAARGMETIPAADRTTMPPLIAATMLSPPPRGVGVLCELRGFGRSTICLCRKWRANHPVNA